MRSQMGGQRIAPFWPPSDACTLAALRARFILYIWWIPSELNFWDEGSRYLDKKFDGSKSLLHHLTFSNRHRNTVGFAVPPPASEMMQVRPVLLARNTSVQAAPSSSVHLSSSLHRVPSSPCPSRFALNEWRAVSTGRQDFRWQLGG